MEVSTNVPASGGRSRRREVPRTPVTLSQGEPLKPKPTDGTKGNFWAKLVLGQTYVLQKQTFTKGNKVEVKPEVKAYLEANATETVNVRGDLQTRQRFEFEPIT